MEATAQDKDAFRSRVQAEQRQNREKTYGKDYENGRHEPMDPIRKMDLTMLKQAVRDLRHKLYRDAEPKPDPVEYIFEGGAEEACRMAGVSLQRLRDRAEEIIADADGELKDQFIATQEDFEASPYDWLSTEAISEKTGAVQNTVSTWCNSEEVNATRLSGPHHWEWRVRMDETLRDRVERYKENPRDWSSTHSS